MATEARRATLEILLSARNASASAFAGVQAGLAKIQNVGREAFASVGRVALSARAQLLGVVAALGGVQKLLIEPAQFEESLVRISIASKTLENDVDRIRTAIEELAVGTGTKREDLASGFEVAAKRAKDFEEALHLVTVANKLATVTNTPVRDSVVELTAVLEAYGIELTQVELVAAKLFATTQKLPNTAGELIGELGKIGPQARAAGVGLEQVLAALVTAESEGKKAGRTLRDFDGILEIVAENSATFRKELAGISQSGVPEFQAAFERVDGTVTSLIDGLKELGKVAALAFAGAQFPDIASFLADAAGNLDRVRISAAIAGLEFARWRTELSPVLHAFDALWNAFKTGLLVIKQGAVVLFKTFVEIPYNLGRAARVAGMQIAAGLEDALAGTKIGNLLGFSAEAAADLRARADLLATEVGEAFDQITQDMIAGADDVVAAALKTDAAFQSFRSGMSEGAEAAAEYTRQIAALRKELEGLGAGAAKGSALIGVITPSEAAAHTARRRERQTALTSRAAVADVGVQERLDALQGIQEQFSFATQPDPITEEQHEFFTQRENLAREHAAALAQIALDARNSVQSSFAGAFDGFVQGTLTAKQALAEFARSIVSMLNQLIANRAFNAIFGGAGTGGAGDAIFGGIVNTIFSAKGNVLPGSFMPVRAFAQGGIATRPTLGVIAEAGMNEAVVPLPDGRRIPVALTGRARGTVNHYWNITAMDGPSVMRTLTSAAGRRAIEAVSDNAGATRRRFQR